MLQYTKRVIKMALGFILLLAGLVMLATPGPGWAAIFGGLALLAGQFQWARRILDYLKVRFVQVRDAAVRAAKKDKPAAAADSVPKP